VVPTYERPDRLMACLDGLEAQTLQPLEVLVVVRLGDQLTEEMLASRKSGLVKMVGVDGGNVPALNAGLGAADGEVVAFTDDDAVPRPDWLARISDQFLRDRQVGGVGGRDLLAGDADPPTADVGRVTWFGRLVGSHHRGVGPSRPVDLLKGVNMAFRGAALEGLKFDERLLGPNMYPHSEIGFCLAVRRAGWRLIYDPTVLVDHYPGERDNDTPFDYTGVRSDDTPRGSEAPTNVFIEAHNELLGLATGLAPWRQPVAIAYFLIVGTRRSPGPLLALERVIVGREGWAAIRRMRAATAGRLRALFTKLGRGTRS
jgi:GT2 family glycosyltransferase